MSNNIQTIEDEELVTMPLAPVGQDVPADLAPYIIDTIGWSLKGSCPRWYKPDGSVASPSFFRESSAIAHVADLNTLHALRDRKARAEAANRPTIAEYMGKGAR